MAVSLSLPVCCPPTSSCLPRPALWPPAGLLGIDIGRAVLYGAFGAVFMTAAGWIFAELYFRNKPESYYTFRDEEAQKEDEATPSIDDDRAARHLRQPDAPCRCLLCSSCSTPPAARILPEDSPILSIVSFVW
ncbi:MAG: hypothetical protein ACLVJH_04210 [Faecalibacterium prausnitzii]